MAKYAASSKIKGNFISSRKKRRNEERRALKQRKHEHYMKKVLAIKDADFVKNEKTKDLVEKVQQKKEKKHMKEKPNQTQKLSKLKSDEKKSQLKEKNLRKRFLLEANEEENKTIRQLEKSLKLHRRKSKTVPKSFMDDGLGYILEIVDDPQSGNLPKEVMSDSDDALDEDIANITGRKPCGTVKPAPKNQDSKGRLGGSKKSDILCNPQCNNPSDSEAIGSDDEDGATEKQGFSECLGQNDEDSNDTDDSSSSENKISGEDEKSIDDTTNRKKKIKSEYWEDIYGRMRDKKGNIVKVDTNTSSGKYIPPAKRLQPGTEDAKKKEELDRLRKQLKGLLNRLSEANIQPIARQIEEMFMKHSRNDINNTLTQLVFEVTVCHSLTPERLVMEHAMLIALLHANVGSEVGAYFLQNIASKFQELQKLGMDGEGKECDNLLILLAHIYNFKVTHSVLIYDILHLLISNFKEKDIELILLLLRTVGFSLRKDDPLALKQVVLEIQKQAATVSAQQSQYRVQFMLEILTAVRNNNMYKIPNYDPSLSEHLKKRIRGMLNKGCSIQTLRISLEDLLKAEEKGRWWIVGSAWIEEHPSQKDNETNTPDKGNRTEAFTTSISDEILDLAKKQRMNTDVRKNIFCILMTSEDYMDAFEKLLRLGLKNQQEREVIHVILDCCLQEKNFNLFYAFLTEKFCKFDRHYQIALQFALWDKFKEMNNLKSWHLNNLADLLVHLFTSGSLPLSILKVIQFADMEKTLMRFLRRILLPILLHKSEEVCCTVFQRIAVAPNMNLLREGLKLFMHHFVLRNKDKLDTDIAEQLTNRVHMVEKILTAAKKAFTV